MNTANKVSVHTIIVTLLLGTHAYADTSDGVIRITSSNTVTTTIDKLETALKSNGMTIFKRIDHAAGARQAGLKLRETELLIFGNPEVGTPLMLCSQTMALELPQKALAYKDVDGHVWLAYNDPAYLARRHGIQQCEEPLQKVTNALARFARIATQ
jgi:uncharacterized protein (DUF302 family)